MADKSGKIKNKGLGTAKTSTGRRSQKMGTEKKSGKWSSKKILQAPIFQWVKQEKWTIFMLIGLFALALFLRAYFFYDTAFATWPPQVAGNDPDYHKWCIDYFQTYHRHLKLDPMLNYPLEGGNPRPPVYDWSIAVLGLILGPLFGGTEKVTWYIFEFNHCVWGALTVIPIFFIGREIFGKKEGLLAGLLFSLSSAHIERSSLGFSDHDAIIVFFLTTGFYFLLKGMSHLEDKNYIKTWLRPGDIIMGLRELFKDTKISMGYFLLAGVSIGTVCLTWQGFGYIFAIIFIYFFVQILLDKFRKVDSLPFFLGIFLVLAIPMVMSFPYYYLMYINAWMTPFFILLGVIVLGVLFVPTRDVPWIVVIPAVAALLGAAYGILGLISPETKDLLFTGGGYFVKSKLYSTIAEAQAPEISRLIISIGPATFFCALIGIVWAAILIPKRLKKDFLFNTVWAGVAIFMAISAVRFEFNATPIFCIMAAWIILKAVNKFNPSGISSVVLSLVGSGIVVGLLVLNYLRIDDPKSDYYFKLDDYSFFDWIGMHSSTTAYLKLTILFVVLLFTLGLFIFLKYVLKRKSTT